MQQFQDNIVKNRLLLEKVSEELSARLEALEKRVKVLENQLKKTP